MSIWVLGFRGAMERDPGDGAQTQPLAGSESGSSFVQVVAQSLAGSGSSLVQDEQPAAVGAASVGASYVDVTGFDDVTTVTSQDQPLAVGSVAEAEPSAENAQPLAGGDPKMALVALRSCTQELEVMKS